MAKAMLLFLVTSVALGMTSLHLVRELRAERATSETLQARVSALEQAKASQPAPVPATPFATWSVQKLAPSADPAPARKPSNGPDGEKLSAVLQAAAQVTPTPNMPTQEERVQQMQEHMERQRALLRDPEYREALRVQHRMAFVRGNPDVVEELGLTSEQANQFFSLMGEQAMRNMDASQAMTWDPAADPATTENAHRKMLDLQRANEAEIAQLLGPQKLKAWKEYQSTLPVRHMANEISQLLASNGVPLQPELTKPLLKILAQEQQRTLQEMQKQAEVATRSNHAQTNMVLLLSEENSKHLERMEEQIRRTREALSSVLTPEQIEIYGKEQDANLQMQRAQWRAMRGPPPPHGTENVAIQSGVGVATMAPMVAGDWSMYTAPAVAVPPPDAN